MNLTPLILQFLLILFSLNNWMLQIIIQNKQISFFKHTFYKNLKSFFFYFNKNFTIKNVMHVIFIFCLNLEYPILGSTIPSSTLKNTFMGRQVNKNVHVYEKYPCLY